MAPGLRAQAREVLELHTKGQHEEALARALELAGANPRSALALNLVGSLHRHSGSAAWNGRASDDDEAASALELHHHHLALDAFSAAAKVAPNCVMTAIAHAKALAACSRLPDAQVELFRVCSIPEANHADPAVHHMGYDLVLDDTTTKKRKSDAAYKANAIMQDFEVIINRDVVPIEAAQLLGGDADVRRRAKLFSQRYPYSARAQLLRVHVELEHVRALDLADKKLRLRVILALISAAAVVFDRSLLIALFHAKVLFVLDDFDEAEKECRRALRIEEPTDPSLDDIPPAVSVPGADCDARVSSVKKQHCVLLKHIIDVAALYWPSIKATQQRRERIISVKVDELRNHYDRIDQSAAKAISDACRFLKKQNSWSFLNCPYSRCDGKKFVDTESLWAHMRTKHRDGLWDMLQSVLGPDLYKNTSNNDHSLDGITLRQDSGQHDIFHLPRVQDMFESLLLSPPIGIQAEPLAEMRRRKCREGAEILEDIKEKLKMLPEDELSTEFHEIRLGIQNLWLKFLETSLLDYREVLLPFARSFQWIEMKRWIANIVNDPHRSIGDANIDAVFGKAPAAPDHRSGDNLLTENLKPSCADDPLKADEKCEERVHEMDSEACRKPLLTRVRQVDPWNAEDIVDHTFNVLKLEQIKVYVDAPDARIHTLIAKMEKTLKPRAPSPGPELPAPSWNSQHQLSEIFEGILVPGMRDLPDPSSSTSVVGIQLVHAGQSITSQIPDDKSIGLKEHSQATSVPGCSNAIGCFPRSSRLGTRPRRYPMNSVGKHPGVPEKRSGTSVPDVAPPGTGLPRNPALCNMAYTSRARRVRDSIDISLRKPRRPPQISMIPWARILQEWPEDVTPDPWCSAIMKQPMDHRKKKKQPRKTKVSAANAKDCLQETMHTFATVAVHRDADLANLDPEMTRIQLPNDLSIEDLGTLLKLAYKMGFRQFVCNDAFRWAGV